MNLHIGLKGLNGNDFLSSRLFCRNFEVQVLIYGSGNYDCDYYL